MGFFVARMAGSQHQAALDLGILGAARAIPVLLLSPLAGVVADHLPRRRVLFVTNTTMALAALLLALLASLHRLDMLGSRLVSALNSAANGFDSPTRQSWVPMLVDREYVGNAVGLNSVAFNAPAVIGPALAGLLIVWIGVAGAFYFNAAATLAVVVAVMLMRPSPPSSRRREPTLQAMRQGIVFIVRHPALRWIVLAQLVTAVLDSPVQPAHRGADGQRLARRRARTGLGGFGGRRRRIRRRARHRVLRSARAALAALAAIGPRDVGRRARAWFRADARRGAAGPIRHRRRNDGTVGRDEHADPNAIARRRARPRARHLHDDRDRRRPARGARGRRDRLRVSVCGRRSRIAGAALHGAVSRDLVPPPRRSERCKKASRSLCDSLK